MRTTAGATVGIVGAVALVMLGACAPSMDGPAERQRAVDREDADRLAAQLARLPGTRTAEVTLRRPARDPLDVSPAGAASAGALLIVDDQADRAAIARAAATLVRAAAPEVEAPAIVVEVGARRPTLARVGPFTVEASSRGPLRAALALALALILALASWIAIRERQRAR